MAVTVTSDQILVHATGGDAEVTTNWNTTGTWAGSPATSNDIYLENANAINARVTLLSGNPNVAWCHLTTSTLNLNLTGKAVFFWIKCFSLPSMGKRAHGGIGVSISSTAGITEDTTYAVPWRGIQDSNQWFVTGNDYEPLSGWVCYVVGPFTTPDLSLGSPNMGSVDRIGIRAYAISAIGAGGVKPFPVIWDRISYGTGLTVICTAGSVATFENIYAADSATANQYGVITKAAGIYFVSGKLVLGTTVQTAVTTFTDTNQVIVWQNMPVFSTLYEIRPQGASGYTTTVTLGTYSGGIASNGCVIRGSGLTTRRLIAATIVSGGTGYTVADILTVVEGTGTVAAQFKVIAISGGVITEARMETAGSYSTPPTGTLTVTGGTGGSATFTATVAGGSIWTLDADGANQTLNLYACSLSQMLSALLTTTTTWRGCLIDDSGQVTANGATIDGCTFQNLRTATPISADYQINVITTTPILTNNRFVNCATAIWWNRGAVTDGKLDGCEFISGGTGHAIEFGTNTPGDPTALTLTDVTFSGYGAGGTTDAAIYNNAGKALIINIDGGTIPTVLNGSGASTTVNNYKVVTISGLTRDVRVLVVADAGGPETEGDALVSGEANAAGVFTGNYNYTSDQPVLLYARLSGWLDYTASGTITNTGLTIVATWQEDTTHTTAYSRNRSVDLDGAADYLVADGMEAAYSHSGGFSILAWYKRDTGTGVDTLLSFEDANGSARCTLAITAAETISLIGKDSSDVTAGQFDSAVGASSVNAWEHIGIAYNPSSATGRLVRINGAASTPSVNTTTATDISALLDTTFLGARESAGDPFDGHLLQLVVADRMLTAAELDEHYNGGVPINPRSLTFASDIVSIWIASNAEYDDATDPLDFRNLARTSLQTWGYGVGVSVFSSNLSTDVP